MDTRDSGTMRQLGPLGRSDLGTWFVLLVAALCMAWGCGSGGGGSQDGDTDSPEDTGDTGVITDVPDVTDVPVDTGGPESTTDADAPVDVPDATDVSGEPDVPEFECPEPSGHALEVDGSDGHVAMGTATGLGLAEFTLEAWINWAGHGYTAGSGLGGVSVIPVIAKGRGEADGSNVDCNYIFGLLESGVLAADFEDMASGQNHPVTGTRALVSGVWYHVAVTYDGATWVLYVNGVEDVRHTVSATPRWDSIQHFGLGTSFDSVGSASGAFAGVMDEVRVWDHARSETDIADGLDEEIRSGAGLVACWALDETSGTLAPDCLGAHPGTVVGGGTWVSPGSPLGVFDPPDDPVLMSPADGAVWPTDTVDLQVWVDDPGGQPLDVTFWGREISAGEDDFVVVVLPDTQYYSESYPDIYAHQTRWIHDNADALNIMAVLHAGDICEHGDDFESEWIAADTAMLNLEDPLPGRSDGLPYGLAVGNHDQEPAADPYGATYWFNYYFGADRFTGRPYWGDHYGSNNDNHYILFEAGGSDYLALFMEYDPGMDSLVLDWANAVIDAHPSHRILVTVHYLVQTGYPGTWGSQGQAVYDGLRHHTNIDAMFCGHIGGEGRRDDFYDGHHIHTFLADYQFRSSGGNGWLRLYTFSPASGTIRVQTYSPWLDEWETDADSEFVVDYDATLDDFVEVSSTTVSGPAAVTATWPGLVSGNRYQWYVTVGNCMYEITSPVWAFERF